MRKALITDVDNTLFDWFSTWYACFSAMLEETLKISKVDRDLLLREMQLSFQRHGTSEYSRVLEDCPSLAPPHIRMNLQPAIEAYRSARDRTLSLYPTVRSTLITLQNMQIPVIAYTESIEYYTSDRFNRLNISPYITALYCPQDHIWPANAERNPDPTPHLKKNFTPPGEMKPNKDILLKITSDLRLSSSECLYVGDSKSKDIAMANAAGITSVWAKYGSSHLGDERYELLRKVTHWTPEAVERERMIANGHHDVSPDFTIDNFSEVLQLL